MQIGVRAGVGPVGVRVMVAGRILRGDACPKLLADDETPKHPRAHNEGNGESLVGAWSYKTG